MKKIAIIGAGGVVFSINLIRDLLLTEDLRQSEIALMDIDRGRLDKTVSVIRKLEESLNLQANIVDTMDLKTAVMGADYVFTVFRVGAAEVDQIPEYEIPKKYGVDSVVGDTLGPAGIFRGLRVLPALFEVLEAMEAFCPGAYLLNYVNPMSINTIALTRQARTVKVVGLCHSVVGTAHEIAGYCGVDKADVTYEVAGINHQAFFLKFKAKGQDAYPLLREAMKKEDVYGKDKVRFEMFRNLDYFVTESSGHNSEYNAYFRKRPDLIEKYCSVSPCMKQDEISLAIVLSGESGASLKFLPFFREDNFRKIERMLDGTEPIELKKSNEYGIQIIEAIESGKPFRANLNVINEGDYIENLPRNACVEVPCYVDESGIHPIKVKNYPEHLAALNRGPVSVQILAAAGAIEHDRHKIFHAIAFDPLSAAVCSFGELQQMTDELFEVSRGKISEDFYK